MLDLTRAGEAIRFRPARAATSQPRARDLDHGDGAVCRFALPSDRGYLAGRHVCRVEDGIATRRDRALGEVLWFQPEVDFWAVDQIEVGDTLATVQGRSARTVAIGSPLAARSWS